MPDLESFLPYLRQFDRSRHAMLDELTNNASLAALAATVAQGTVSSHELTLFYLTRIFRHDHALHSVMEINPDVLLDAAWMDRQLATSGQVHGPLHGVPILLKDNIGTGDRMHNSAGAVVLAEHRAPRDAELVVRLRKAGAILLGKTCMSEWAYFMSTRAPSGYSALGGQVVNPYGAELEVRGSSSGSAAAVAAGFAAAAIGTETNGSIIAPASACGVSGMRPSTGIVSTEMIIPVCKALDGAGPLTRCVDDLDLLLSVMSDVHPRDLSLLKGSSLRGMRLGFVRVDEKLRDVTEREPFLRVVHRLRQAGAELVPCSVSSDSYQQLSHLQFQLLSNSMSNDLAVYLQTAEAEVSSMQDIVDFNERSPLARAAYGQDLLVLAAASRASRTATHALAEQVKSLAMEILNDTVNAGRFDLILSVDNDFSLVYASAGVPAVTVPAGLDMLGQPRGATFVGLAPGTDRSVLSAAAAFEAIVGRGRPPVLVESHDDLTGPG